MLKYEQNQDGTVSFRVNSKLYPLKAIYCVSASKHGVVQNCSFPAIIPTSLFEAFFSASFQAALLR